MKPGLVFILLCLLELFAVAQASLNLPLPDGGRVQFVPVFLKIGPKLRSSRNFVMGDRKQPPRWEERPTEVAIGGSFVIPDAAGRKDWGYYLGVTEVTEAQWNAVMGASGGSDLPKTDVSFFDVQDFIRRWNEWLHKNVLADLPANEGSHGYVRLPTEVEWEFAARGGTVVPQELFDAVHPYSDLSRHEWFFGVDDSPHVHPVGTREKNPLGLSDMLGNVSELTMGEFHLEYYLGRVGGCVVRGGTYISRPSEIRASKRLEFPLYSGGMPNRSKTVGFRLAVGADIMWGASTLKALDAELAVERANPEGGGIRLPPRENRLSKSDQRDRQLKNASQGIDSLHKALAGLQVALDKGDDIDAMKRSVDEIVTGLASINAELDGAQEKIREKDRKLARSFMRQTSTRLMLLYGLWQNLDDVGGKAASLQAPWNAYWAGIEDLALAKDEDVAEALVEQREYLKGEKNTQQMRITEHIPFHLKLFKESKARPPISEVGKFCSSLEKKASEN